MIADIIYNKYAVPKMPFFGIFFPYAVQPLQITELDRHLKNSKQAWAYLN